MGKWNEFVRPHNVHELPNVMVLWFQHEQDNPEIPVAGSIWECSCGFKWEVIEIKSRADEQAVLDSPRWDFQGKDYGLRQMPMPRQKKSCV